ncbi:MAG: hypothetical protein IT383_09325 [Deltaproteobacteria bacterium]|nr:hypothetical protein [Deltaproteobacteria bacterium]
MATEPKPSSKKTLQSMFAEPGDRKLVLLGPNNSKLQDSRFSIEEAALDHVLIKLLGDEHLVVPYAAITDVKLERQVMTIRYR